MLNKKEIIDNIRSKEKEWKKIWKEEIDKGRGSKEKPVKRMELLVIEEEVEKLKRTLKEEFWSSLTSEEKNEVKDVLKNPSQNTPSQETPFQNGYPTSNDSLTPQKQFWEKKGFWFLVIGTIAIVLSFIIYKKLSIKRE